MCCVRLTVPSLDLSYHPENITLWHRLHPDLKNFEPTRRELVSVRSLVMRVCDSLQFCSPALPPHLPHHSNCASSCIVTMHPSTHTRTHDDVVSDCSMSMSRCVIGGVSQVAEVHLMLRFIASVSVCWARLAALRIPNNSRLARTSMCAVLLLRAIV